jgi:hypothetical protein
VAIFDKINYFCTINPNPTRFGQNKKVVSGSGAGFLSEAQSFPATFVQASHLSE